MLGKIVVAVDGSPHAERALEVAVDLAKKYQSELDIVTVIPTMVVVASTEPWVPPQLPETETKYYHDLIEKATRKATELGVPPKKTLCLEGHVVDELLAFTEKELPDLFIVGSRGLSTARRLLLGSVSDALVHHVKCPILIVKRG
ncbi:MAG: universal stress protein [Candidatus Thermoplasmatota archaeon]|jgi:nucleotide-binding universal stress UspA family protein|nr:universal stress protein [Candidatus Thermoplasmatota archaeon]MCL5984550.1 universal stress protein [Candidatus Thermoplasmatota archaeon]